MYMPYMRILKIAVITCLSSIFYNAQGEDLVEYKVEMILFQHLDSQGAGAEHNPGGTLWPNLENAAELSMDAGQSDYQILPEHDKNLSSVVAMLNSSSRYNVIKHLVWRRPMHTRALAKPLHMHGGTDFSRQFPARFENLNALSDSAISDEVLPSPSLKQVDGTIKLFVGRYLHVHTDLIYRQAAVLREENTENGLVKESNVLIDYKVHNNRKMRSAELHYLDHPMLGILVEITPLEKSSQPQN